MVGVEVAFGVLVTVGVGVSSIGLRSGIFVPVCVGVTSGVGVIV